MNPFRQTPQWGSFALVSYIPDPLGSFLDRLRQSLPCEGIPQAHITILPPRPLLLPMESASEEVFKLLSGFRAFPVGLSVVRRFRQTDVVYLDVAEGNTRLHALHDALSIGALAHDEEFAFRPHLTLGVPSSAQQAEPLWESVKAAWELAAVERRFLLDEIACLWLPPDALPNRWQRVWSHSLKTRATVNAPTAPIAFTARTY